MDLNAYTRTISTLFSTNVKYIVPRFQREYSWTKEEVNELWYDIISNIKLNKLDGDRPKNFEYFIGSLVLIGEDKSPSLLIVDGQQRLTTITIFLSALVHTFNGIGERDLAQGIYHTYIEGKDLKNKPFFKLENENPKPFLHESIQHITKSDSKPTTKEERTLWDSYTFFINQLKKDVLKNEINFWNQLSGTEDAKYISVLELIRDQILLHLKVIYITVASEDDAYMIFETLNARGKNLTSIDLVKNELFKTLNSTHPDDSAKTNWKKIQQNLMSRNNKINIETFFRHYWLSKYNFITESKIYKNFKVESNKSNFDHFEFIKDLVFESELYNKVANPLKTDWPNQEDHTVYNSLEALNTFQITQIRTFILALLIQRRKNLISHFDFCDILKKMENFHFKYSAICALKMNIFEGKYSKTARDLRGSISKQNSSQILAQLSQFYVGKQANFELFKDKFRKLRFTTQFTRDKKLIQYIFRKFELNLRSTQELSVNNITLEHIDSQSHGSTAMGEVGNLIPLDKSLNEKCDNKPFKEKIEVYKNSDLKVISLFLNEFENELDWNENTQNKWFDIIVDNSYNKIWIINP